LDERNRRAHGKPASIKGSRHSGNVSFAAERTQARRARAAARERSSRRGRVRSPEEAWLEERDARQPPTRSDLHSRADEAAARVVAAGGGSQALIEATGLRTFENVARLIDPVIVRRALPGPRKPGCSP
jgi:hypothetical protein